MTSVSVQKIIIGLDILHFTVTAMSLFKVSLQIFKRLSTE